jgi:bifunctional DNA-binding transcriptional regulator/antitoxin component of YhaV-PrlF toxin-antitoxin module
MKYEEAMMPTLTVTERGQVTFRKEVLQHLGIRPGQKIEFDLLSNGRIGLRAARPSGSMDKFIGMLENKTGRVITIEEMEEAAAAGWAGEI